MIVKNIIELYAMKKKTYIKPDIEVVSIEGEALICFSQKTSEAGSGGDNGNTVWESKGRSSGDDEGGYGFDYDW